MGEDVFEGEVKLYVGDEHLDMGNVHDEGALEFSVHTPVNPFVGVDNSNGKDYSSETVWNPETGEVVCNITIKAEDTPIGRWFFHMWRKFRREKKALKWAVTHKHIIRVIIYDDYGNEGYVEISKPSQLNKVLRMTKFIPDYRIYDESSSRCIIKRGRVVKMPVWPVTPDYIGDIEKKVSKLMTKKR